jgi:hypothetical protein
LKVAEAHKYWTGEVQKDCLGLELQALQRGRPLPRESLVARFNPFFDDEFLRDGGRL